MSAPFIPDNFDWASNPESRRPPPGKIWRCAACGRSAVDQFGMIGPRSIGWDESCMLNAVAVPLARRP